MNDQKQANPSDRAGSSSSAPLRQQFSAERSLQKRGNFTIVPNEILRKMDLKGWPRLVWIYLLSHSENYHPRNKQICSDMGVSDKTVTTALKKLVDANMISVLSVGTHNEYDVLPPESWDLSTTDAAKWPLTENFRPIVGKTTTTLSIENTNKNTTTEPGQADSPIDRISKKVHQMFIDCGYDDIQFTQIRYSLALVNRNLNFSWEEIEAIYQKAGPFFVGSKHKRPTNGLFNWFACYRKPKNSPKKPNQPAQQPSLADWGVA